MGRNVPNTEVDAMSATAMGECITEGAWPDILELIEREGLKLVHRGESGPRYIANLYMRSRFGRGPTTEDVRNLCALIRRNNGKSVRVKEKKGRIQSVKALVTREEVLRVFQKLQRLRSCVDCDVAEAMALRLNLDYRKPAILSQIWRLLEELIGNDSLACHSRDGEGIPTCITLPRPDRTKRRPSGRQSYGHRVRPLRPSYTHSQS